jgi:hypothetical protein
MDDSDWLSRLVVLLHGHELRTGFSLLYKKRSSFLFPPCPVVRFVHLWVIFIDSDVDVTPYEEDFKRHAGTVRFFCHGAA